MNTPSFTLRSGEHLALHLPRGTRLVVLSGRLRAQAPALWLGDTLIRRHEDWHEGHVSVIDDTGSWQWQAPVPAMLLVCRPRPLWRPWLDAVLQKVRPASSAPCTSTTATHREAWGPTRAEVDPSMSCPHRRVFGSGQ